MKTNLLSALGLACFIGLNLPAALPSTAFTYQGQLSDGGTPAGGKYEFTFQLFNDPLNSNNAGKPITNLATVSGGLFTTSLDFGIPPFEWADVWLEIGVRTNGSGGEFVLLAPRQPITPTPLALVARKALSAPASGLTGVVPSASLAGTYGEPVQFTSANNAFAGDGSGLGDVNAVALGGLGASAFWQLGGNAGTGPADFLGTTDEQPLVLRVNNQPALRLEPTLTNGAVNIIGGSPLNTIKNGAVGVTIAGGGSGNHLGSTAGNSVQANYGAIAGGLSINVGGWGGFVGGGVYNAVNAQLGVVGGGKDNLIESGSDAAVVAGGIANVFHGSTSHPEGWSDSASAIVGGMGNWVGSNVFGATIVGGNLNEASASYTFAAGRQAKARHRGAFVWADPNLDPFASERPNEFALRAAGGLRLESDRGITLNAADAPLITRGWDVFTPEAGPAKDGLGRWGLFMEPYALTLGIPSDDVPDRYFQIAKYETNGTATALMTVDQTGAVTANAFRINNGLTLGTNFLSAPTGRVLDLQAGGVSGLRLQDAGLGNINISGGFSMNYVADNIRGGTIAGGGIMWYSNSLGWSYTYNTVLSDGGTVGGGMGNSVGYASTNGTVAGGYNNAMSGSIQGFIGGGNWNAIYPGANAVIGGGYGNTIGYYGWYAGDYAVIAGGSMNAVWSTYSTIGGGRNNSIGRDGIDDTIAGGYNNHIEFGDGSSTIGGGAQNTIHSNTAWATIPGGFMNEALGTGSFAAGVGAQALHGGSFVWCDKRSDEHYTYPFPSVRTNEFAIRALGGVRLESSRGIAEDAADAPIITRGWDAFNASAGYAKEGHGRWGLFMEPAVLALGMPDSPGATIRLGKYAANGAFTSLADVDQNGDFHIAGTYYPSSDRNVKQDFAPVNPGEVLAKVAAMPVQTWSYTNSPTARHIGPMAQDFRAAFGLGADDKHIATIDSDGVALAAIQGLNQKLEERLQAKDAELQALKASVMELQEAVRRLNPTSK